MISDATLEEIIFRIHIKQLPNLNNLTELEYIYYSGGFFHFNKEKDEAIAELIKKIFKEVSEAVNYFAYEAADIKAFLYDLSSSTRGLAGVKKGFDLKSLPSAVHYNKKKEEEAPRNETHEEKLERHRRFFKELKESFKQ